MGGEKTMLEIQRMISKYNYSSRQGNSIKYIILHFTGNSRDKAISNANYFNECDRGASAHYFCDDDSIWQVVEEYNSSWAIGGGVSYGALNRNSISIEMCCSGDYQVSETTENNAIELTKYLMNKYGIDIDHVIRHYDCNTINKVCPNWSDNSWARWYDFKDRLANGSTIKGEWILDNTGYWYKHSDGTYTKSGWEKINSEWYLFDERGYMDYSWKKSDGNWYYLGESNDGSLKTGWIYDKEYKAWFYSNSNGVMLTGWQKISNEWYYFDGSGIMKTGWIQDSGNDYLLYSNGIMAHDITIYGYQINSSGQAIKIQ